MEGLILKVGDKGPGDNPATNSVDRGLERNGIGTRTRILQDTGCESLSSMAGRARSLGRQRTMNDSEPSGTGYQNPQGPSI